MKSIDALESILHEFEALTKIPHPSHHEEKISQYLFDWAKNRRLAVERDPLG